MVVKRGYRNGLQPANTRFHRNFHYHGIQSTMREDQHHVPWAYRMILKEHASIALSSLEPEQAFRSAGAQHVEPHQSRVHERMKAGEATVARENVEHGQNRVAAPEEVYETTFLDGLSHGLCSPLDLADCVLQIAWRTLVIFSRYFERHTISLLRNAIGKARASSGT